MKNKLTQLNGIDSSVMTFGKVSALAAALVTTSFSAQASADYGPAVWRPACSGKWYTSGYGKKFFVEHDMEGYYLTSIAYLNQCGVQASVHYAVNGKKDNASDAAPGEVSQMVSDVYYAWHASCWNQHSMGTEHEGFASNPAWYTDEMYNASALLTASKANKYGFAKDRNHIVGHGEKSNGAWVAWAGPNLGINATCNTHTDPGPYWDWNKYMGLVNGGGAPSPTPAVIANSDGRQELFAINLGGGTDHSWQTAANGGWSGWAGIGGYSTKIVAARNQNGTLEVFAIGTGLTVYHSWGTGWAGYFSMGGTMVDIDVGMNPDGRLELFGVGYDGKLYHNWQLTANGATGWSGWYLIGGSGMNRVMVAKNQDGHLEAFTVGYNTMYHSWSGPSGWVAPVAFAGSFIRDWSDFGSVLWADGRLEIFSAATGGDVVHMWQLAPNGTTGWSGWASLGGGGVTKVATGVNQNGRPELFVISGTTPYHNWWTGSTWSGFYSFGGAVRSLAVGKNLDGRQEIFGVGTDNQMYHNYQTAPNGGWSGWYGMGGSFK